MSMAEVVRWIYEGQIFAATVPAVGFVIDYHRRSRGAWREHPMGRHVMGFVAAFAAVLLLVAVNLVVMMFVAGPAPEWYVWLYLVAFTGVPVVLWQRWAKLRRTNSDHAERVSSEDAHSS